MSSEQWPTSREYVEAIQSPRLCFDDPRLKLGVPALDRLGLPTVTSGQFAYVFKVNHPNGSGAEAVRCFRSWSHDRELRYRYINLHLDEVSDPYLASFEYDPKGIRVRGLLWPTLVMEWIEGHSLDVYLDRVVGNPQALTYLAKMWLNALRSLRDHEVAHGDLQHGNILVDGASMLRIVDLDGMYVPAMAGWSAPELGHRHYQHPARADQHFGPTLDNFSGLVIYLSLLALKESPDLWKRYHDENLLLVKQDFEDPLGSAALSDIRNLGGECARLAGALVDACREDPMSCPSVLDLVASPARAKPAWMTETPTIAVPIATREVRPGTAPAPVATAHVPVQPSMPTVPTPPWWRRPVSDLFTAASATPSSSRAPTLPSIGQSVVSRIRAAAWMLLVRRPGVLLLAAVLMIAVGVAASGWWVTGDPTNAPDPLDAVLADADSTQVFATAPGESDTRAARAAAPVERSGDKSPAPHSPREDRGSRAAPPVSSSAGSVDQIERATTVQAADGRDQLARATIGAPRSEADRQAAIPLFDRGTTHFGAHRWGDAKADFKAALRLDGSVAAYHAALGEVFIVEEDWAGAAAEFAAANVLDRDNAEYRARLKEARSRM